MTECRHCGAPEGHNATCIFSIKERNARIDALEQQLAAKDDTIADLRATISAQYETQLSLTARLAAKDAEISRLRGTMECPICGVDRPHAHAHTHSEIMIWVRAQASRFGVEIVESAMTFRQRVDDLAQEIANEIVSHYIPASRESSLDRLAIQAREQRGTCKAIITKNLQRVAQPAALEAAKDPLSQQQSTLASQLQFEKAKLEGLRLTGPWCPKDVKCAECAEYYEAESKLQASIAKIAAQYNAGLGAAKEPENSSDGWAVPDWKGDFT